MTFIWESSVGFGIRYVFVWILVIVFIDYMKLNKLIKSLRIFILNVGI